MTALLTENIGPLSLAPDGVQRLRALVLDLAVRGLLTQPHEGDDRADDLLAQIFRDREGLVAAGDLKFKALPALKREEVPYQLPAHWLWARLGEITNYGATTKANTIPDDAWLLDLEDVEKDTSRLLRRVRFIERGSLSDKNAFRTGDVLYCKLRPYLNKVIVADQDGYCTTEILPVRCHGRWVPAYFQLALKSPQFLAYVNRKSYGMKMPRLGTEDGRMAAFPLPPLAEQHRIVAKVDELMALCDRLEARQQDAEAAHARLVQALLDSLTQARDADEFQACWQRLALCFESVLTNGESVEAFEAAVFDLAARGVLTRRESDDEPATLLLSDIAEYKTALSRRGLMRDAKSRPPIGGPVPFDLPNTWCWARWDDVALKIGDIDHKMPEPDPNGVPFVSPRDFYPGNVIDFEGAKRVARADYERLSSKIRAESGDLIYPRYGTIGENVLVTVDREFLVSYSCAVIKVARGFVEPEYQFFVSLSGCIRRQAKAAENKTTQANVGIKSIQEFLFPLPPLAEQRRIVAKVTELLGLCDQLKARIAAARAKHAQLAEALVAQAVAA